MKKICVAAAAAMVLIITGCQSSPKSGLGPAPEYEERTDSYQVLDHKTKAIGGEVPEWVTRYIEKGLSAVEQMPDYQGKYVFISEASGINLNALRQWATGFSIAQDFSRMVSTRVQTKFAGAAAGSPDDAFGRYFEDVVKTTSDATYSGARKETDFWLYKRNLRADKRAADRDMYEYYVLVTIDRESFEQQINDILNDVKTDTPLTREQSTAIERVKEAFYEGF